MAQLTLLFIGLLFVTVSLAFPQGPPDGVISQGPPPGVVPTGSQYQGPPPGVVPGPPQAVECPNPSTIESFDKDKVNNFAFLFPTLGIVMTTHRLAQSIWSLVYR